MSKEFPIPTVDAVEWQGLVGIEATNSTKNVGTEAIHALHEILISTAAANICG